MKTSIFYILQLLIFIPSVRSQNFTLHLKNKESGETVLLKERLDSVQTYQVASQWVVDQHSRDYLLSSIDSISFYNKVLVGEVFVGKKYMIDSIGKGNVPDWILNKCSYREKYFSGKSFKKSGLGKLEECILDQSDLRGFPFASVNLENIIIKDGKISAGLKWNSGPIIVFDTIAFLSNTTVKQKYLSDALNIRRGSPFSQKILDQSANELRSWRFIKLRRKPYAQFRGGRAYTTIEAVKRNANQINGILGLLPGEGTNNRILITGEFKLDLYNLFSSGKHLKAQWRKLQPLTQVLDLNYKHPDFLRSRLNTEFGLYLLKQDTSFLNVNRFIQIGKKLSGSGLLSVRTELETTRLLSASQYDSLNSPEFLDADKIDYSIHYSWNNLDDLFYPKKGISLSFKMVIGNKNIIDNNQVDEVHYQNLELKSVQYGGQMHMEKYTRLGKQTVLMTRAMGGIKRNPNLFLNDLYRLGGLKTIRGFNENNFFASDYLIGTTEFRVYTDPESYLFLFYDQGWLSYSIPNNQYEDFPLGIGAGVSFTTPGGIFSFVYSLGNSRDQKLDFQLSKIHFGLVSTF